MTDEHADGAEPAHEPVHDSGHGHDHSHAAPTDLREPAPEHARLLERVVAALVDKGILTRAEIAAQIEDMAGRVPANGARLIARCWTDPEFRALALRDLPAAAGLEGISMPPYPEFVLLENTEAVHHLVVCTLCSCYPRPILGPPPVWYKSRSYRSRAVSEPRAVLAEFGTVPGPDTKLVVVDSTADRRYLVMPRRPAGTDDLTPEELAALVNRDSMIGARDASVPAG